MAAKDRRAGAVAAGEAAVLGRVPEALAALGAGSCVVLVGGIGADTGSLLMSALAVTGRDIARFLEYTSGVIFAPMLPERTEQLELPTMVGDQGTGGSYTVSVDARHGTIQGVSAADRAVTLNALADPSTGPGDLKRPGHVFPIRGTPGGVFLRPGHTEATLDLLVAAGLPPVGVLSALVSEGGLTVSTMPDLEPFAAGHRFPLVSVAEVIQYRLHRERLVSQVAEARLPTVTGTYGAKVFESALDDCQHLALVMGEIMAGDEVLVAVHEEDFYRDLLPLTGRGEPPILRRHLERIAAKGRGVLVYLRGAGPEHLPSRNAVIAAKILRELGVRSMRLMSGPASGRETFEAFGLKVHE